MSDLVTRLRCWCEEDDEEHAIVNEALDAIESLQAVIAALPKCWRLNDAGERVQDVPVVPGMHIWFMWCGIPTEWDVTGVHDGRYHYLNLSHATHGSVYRSAVSCYSTEAAARAAGEEA